MATEYIKIKGKTKWFKYAALNKFGKWSHDLYPDAESLEKLRDLQAEGMKNVIHKDDDGYWITFSRQPFITKRDQSKTPLAPPVVMKDDKPFHENVGNGSDVVTTLEVYQHNVPNSTKKAKAVRWYGSDIVNLIPFSKTDMTAGEQEAAEKVTTWE